MTEEELEKKWENTVWDTDIYLDDIDEELKPCPLKPCPFCGGEAEYDEDFFGRAYIQCSNCEAHLQDKKAYQDCIEAWNKRVVAE